MQDQMGYRHVTMFLLCLCLSIRFSGQGLGRRILVVRDVHRMKTFCWVGYLHSSAALCFVRMDHQKPFREEKHRSVFLPRSISKFYLLMKCFLNP
ncbi:hypothetical protein SADUNF_Sadunf09G0000300 [Salix dunnii]|uniref:Secreted protein n=1 Tax=Salix dunnii TaxID=1413687 RepID=A0A835JSA8_9ROSI|nr:hypothetical protein SADUNF_Sadunf09G0000300 [Salix dunnii]